MSDWLAHRVSKPQEAEKAEDFRCVPQVRRLLGTKLDVGSPVSRVRANTDGASASNVIILNDSLTRLILTPLHQTFAVPSTGSQSKVPSKLRDSSIASFGLTQSTPSSRSSSPGTPMASHMSTSTSTSTFSMKSPPRPIPTVVPKKKGRPPKNGAVKAALPPPPAPTKPISPPRPPLPPIIRAPDPDFHIGGYLILCTCTIQLTYIRH